MSVYYGNGELYHHGIKGQKWGIRRYQNNDGSYTPSGKKRHRDSNPDNKTKRDKAAKIVKNVAKVAITSAAIDAGIQYLIKRDVDFNKLMRHTALNVGANIAVKTGVKHLIKKNADPKRLIRPAVPMGEGLGVKSINYVAAHNMQNRRMKSVNGGKL